MLYSTLWAATDSIPSQIRNMLVVYTVSDFLWLAVDTCWQTTAMRTYSARDAETSWRSQECSSVLWPAEPAAQSGARSGGKE
jgi:hypothetical protein